MAEGLAKKIVDKVLKSYSIQRFFFEMSTLLAGTRYRDFEERLNNFEEITSSNENILPVMKYTQLVDGATSGSSIDASIY